MEYLLKSILCLLILLLIYRVLLQREVLYRFNRFYLLGSLVLSFLIPLITIEVPAEIPNVDVTTDIQWEQPIVQEYGQIEPEVYQDDQDFTEPNIAAQEGLAIEIPWTTLAGLAYILVCLIFSVRFFRNLHLIKDKVRKSIQVEYRGEILVLLNEKISPFSFLKYIFLARETFESEGVSEAVFIHEQCHVRERHSWDILLVEVLLIPLWFHPGLYFLRQSIRLNHEFIADQEALKTTSLQNYSLELISVLAASPQLKYTSSLNFSLTKKRLKMMNRQSNKSRKYLAILSVLPLLALSGYFFSEKVEVAPKDDALAISKNPSEGKEMEVRLISGTEVEVDGNAMPIQELSNWLDDFGDAKPIVRFSANSNVNMGALADVQEILRAKEIRQVVFDAPNQTNSDSELEKKREAFYRNAYILVEDENMQYSNKTYQELTAKEKLRLLDPLEVRDPMSPDPAIFEAWKDGKTYAIWIDGVVSPNEKLKDYVPTDFAGFFQSGVKQNARSARFPQPYQVHLYSESYYDENFGPKSEMHQPRTNLDTITLTQRGMTWHKDIQNYPDPTTAYLQKYVRYENLRTSGALYEHKSTVEKKELNEQYQELVEKFSKFSEGKKKTQKLKEPNLPDSENERYQSPVKGAVEENSNKGNQISLASFVFSPSQESPEMMDYLTLYGEYQTQTYENRLFAQPVIWEILDQQKKFRTLEAKYNALSFADRRRVKRAAFPYVKMKDESGKEVFVKIEDLTPQQRAAMGC